ncbi:MAG: glycoside hydrolase family 3 N-terminal domain-containing protein [Motilibacteraceae bacterium]
MDARPGFSRRSARCWARLSVLLLAAGSLVACQRARPSGAPTPGSGVVPSVGTTVASSAGTHGVSSGAGTVGSPPGPTSSSARASVTAPACTNARMLAGWSTARLAAQTVAVPVQETAVAGITPQVRAGAGAVLLFGSRAPAGLAAALARLRAAAPGGVAPLVMVDEEGGPVQRMPNVVGVLPSARRMAVTMTAAQVEALAVRTGRRLRGVGVGADLAPVLDLDAAAGPNARDPIGVRSFSADPGRATTYGLAFARGLRTGGVVPVVKHFPGLGGAVGNSETGAAATRPWSVVRSRDLAPFRAAVRAGLPAVMVANARVPGLTRYPASVSYTAITTVLRGQLGFHGLVMTDSLTAGALRAAGYPLPAAAVLALRAGADLVLFDATPATVAARTASVQRALVAAVTAGTLSRARLVSAAGHVLSAKPVSLCPR